MSAAQNPYPYGSPQWLAFQQAMAQGVAPASGGGNLDNEAAQGGVPMPTPMPQQGGFETPAPGVHTLAAPISAAQRAQIFNAPAAQGKPAAPAAPNRTYDAKGHASDGSQSIGLDNPWKIGAFAGGTYDHDTLATLAAIADGKAPPSGGVDPGGAAYILTQVGFKPDGQPNYEQRWAAQRKLDRYAQTPEAGGASPWWHDPANAPADQRDTYGGAYKNEADATSRYGWWDQPNAPTPQTQTATPPADNGGYVGQPAAPREPQYDPAALTLGNGQDPTYSADPNNPDHARPDPANLPPVIGQVQTQLDNWWNQRG